VPYTVKGSEQPYTTLNLRKGKHPTVLHRYGAVSAYSVERLDLTIRSSNHCTRNRRYLGSTTLPPVSGCRPCIRGVQLSGPEVDHLPSAGVELNNKYSCTSSPPIRLRGVNCDNVALSFEPWLCS